MTTTVSLSVKKPYKFKKPPLASESQTMPTSTTTLDFGSLMSLPISNEENQKLEEQVNEQKFKLEKCQREISGLDQSIQTMWQHLQNIRSDVDQNQVIQKIGMIDDKNRTFIETYFRAFYEQKIQR